MENLSVQREQRANFIHQRILANGQIAAQALVAMCKDLKQMRDEKLYEELDYSSFEDYAEKACGIKQRQAYCYISAYEKLGSNYIEENAKLGITKLELISQVSSFEREEFLKENNVGELSTRELKEKIAEYKRQNEQLSFEFDEIKEKLEKTELELIGQNEASDNSAIALDDANKRIAELEKQLKEETANKEIVINPEEIAKQVEAKTTEIQKQYEQRFEEEKQALKEDHAEELEKAVKKAKQETKGKFNDVIDKLTEEKKNADTRLQQALKEAKVSNADEDTIAVRILFADLQSNANTIQEHLEKIKLNDNEKATKLATVISKTLQQLAESFN